MSDQNPPYGDPPGQPSQPDPVQPQPGWNAPPPPPPPAGGYASPPPGGGYAGMGGSTGPMSDFGRPLAEWWKRLVAVIIDGVIVGIPTSIIVNIIGFGAASTAIDPNTGLAQPGAGGILAGGFIGSFLLSIAIPIIYFGVMNGSEKGQTVGKMVMKIQVRQAGTGGPIGVGKGFLRYLVYGLLAALTCGIGGLLDGLWPLWDAKRQALHDKAVNSVVVDAA